MGAREEEDVQEAGGGCGWGEEVEEGRVGWGEEVEKEVVGGRWEVGKAGCGEDVTEWRAVGENGMVDEELVADDGGRGGARDMGEALTDERRSRLRTTMSMGARRERERNSSECMMMKYQHKAKPEAYSRDCKLLASVQWLAD